MNTYIHHCELLCTLGRSLDSGIHAYSKYQTDASLRLIDILKDPVEIPYFLIPDNAQLSHELMYQTLSQQVQACLQALNLEAGQVSRCGLFLASSSFSANQSEHEFLFGRQEEKLILPQVGYGRIAATLRQEFNLSACSSTFVTACTSSAVALIYARAMLNKGLIDHAIVLGFEFFNYSSALGFHGLDLLSPTKKLSPFDKRRNGLLLGEGSAAICLSREVDKEKIQFCGGAINTDSHSLTAANPNGSSIADVLALALSAARYDRSEVRAIKTHGTASIMNDEAEAAGIRLFFGEHVPSLFAMKPYLGHTLGACGAIETALLVAALENNWVPSNPGLGSAEFADPELAIELSQVNGRADSGIYLANYFAFGGSNAVLALRKS